MASRHRTVPAVPFNEPGQKCGSGISGAPEIADSTEGAEKTVMRNRVLPVALALFAVSAGSSPADLKQAIAEPNLEKRSKLALENAAAAYKAIREAYEKGETEQVSAAAKELEESVELAN